MTGYGTESSKRILWARWELRRGSTTEAQGSRLNCRGTAPRRPPCQNLRYRRLGQLYAIETEIRGRAPDARRKIRQSRSRPLLESLHEWFESSLAKLSAKSETASSIRYALTRWSALVRFCDDGRLEVDNNSAERALRAVALGRNYAQFGIMRSSRSHDVPSGFLTLRSCA